MRSTTSKKKAYDGYDASDTNAATLQQQQQQRSRRLELQQQHEREVLPLTHAKGTAAEQQQSIKGTTTTGDPNAVVNCPPPPLPGGGPMGRWALRRVKCRPLLDDLVPSKVAEEKSHKRPAGEDLKVIGGRA